MEKKEIRVDASHLDFYAGGGGGGGVGAVFAGAESMTKRGGGGSRFVWGKKRAWGIRS